MHAEHVGRWEHSHTFGQDVRRPGERRTLVVIALTTITMVVELVAGSVFGSMALLADGLHMGSHAVALAIAAFAYIYARRHAGDRAFSFGTGKVNALAGFGGAVLLGGFALVMAWESIGRLIEPVSIAFDQAIAVAVLGLVVNGACVFILGKGHGGDGHEGGDAHPHHHGHHHGHEHGHDHNLRSAYLHVLADALTSLLAIVALLFGRFFGLNWLDPVMGLVGAALITHWSVGLLRQTARVLLDRQAPSAVCDRVREAVEAVDEDRVADLHLWSVGPGLLAAELAVVTHTPTVTPDDIKSRLPDDLRIVHATIEIHRCPVV